MAYAIYNSQTQKVKSFVKEPKGAVPEGYAFVLDSELPQGWTLEEKTPQRVVCSPMEFLLKFTPQERAAMIQASKTDAQAADFMLILQTATEIWSDHPFTIDGLQMLVTAGIITEQRKAEILS